MTKSDKELPSLGRFTLRANNKLTWCCIRKRQTYRDVNSLVSGYTVKKARTNPRILPLDFHSVQSLKATELP